MSVELVHSSVPRDLDGQQGFGVAAMTRDLPRALRDELVARSDGSELAGGAHRVVSYVVCQAGGAAWPVLTAVTRCGSDWSGRGNRVAHHLVVSQDERGAAGPVVLAAAFPFADTPPEIALRDAPAVPQDLVPMPAPSGIDPGWWPLLAERAVAADAGRVALKLPAGIDPLLALGAIVDAVEPRRRWAVQWSTGASLRALPGLASIVIDAHDASAFDLAAPAPQPMASVAPGPVGSAREPAPEDRGAPIDPGAGLVHPTVARPAPRPIGSSAGRGPAPRGEGAGRGTRPGILPLVLFVIAAVIALVALGLLLW